MGSELNLCSVGVIRELLSEFDSAPRKDFGQNFLTNPSVPKKIAEIAGGSDVRNVIEVGPGIGCLTRELSAVFERVAAVEIDKKLIPLLDRTLAGCENVTVTNADVMSLDIAAFAKECFSGEEYCVCANLPYYITTPVIMKFLREGGEGLRSMTVMVQSEVADRLTAREGTADYGMITAGIAYYGHAERVMKVSAGNFYPVPKVNSAVVRITLYEAGEEPFHPIDDGMYFSLISAAFAERRKTLVNSASSGLSIPKPEVERVLSSLGYDVRVRGEVVSPEGFCRISDALSVLQAREMQE